MSRTLSPAVSVILSPLGSHADAASSVRASAESLRHQSLTDLEILVPAASLPETLALDPRVRALSPASCPVETINRGLESARGARVLILDPRDQLEPFALEALAVRTRHAGTPGAFALPFFRAPFGDLPATTHEEMHRDVPALVGADELLRACFLPLSLTLIERARIASIRLDASLAQRDSIHAAAYDWLLRLANTGVTFSRVGRRLGTLALRPLDSNTSLLQSLRLRARIVHDRTHERFADFSQPSRIERIREHTQDCVDAYCGLLQDIDAPPNYYCVKGLSTAAMARWWQRLDYLGPAPSRLRPGLWERAPEDVHPTLGNRLRAIFEDLDPTRPVVLVGSGQELTVGAGMLAGLGVAPIVLDPGGALTTPPRWAIEEKMNLRLLSGADQAPRGAQFVALTPSDHDAIAPCLPARARLLTLSQAEALLHAPAPQRAPLNADGSMPLPAGVRGMFRLPLLVAEHLAQQVVSRSRVALLLGLGRNARRVARLLHASGVRLLARDDALSGPPEWSHADEIPLELLTPRDTPPADAIQIMTVLHDAGFLRALGRADDHAPGPLLLRWTRAAEHLQGLRPGAWHTPTSLAPTPDRADEPTAPRVHLQEAAA